MLTPVSYTHLVRVGYITFIDGTQVGQIQFWILGLSLMLLMIFRPQGILGDKRELAFDVK